ncbi:beta-1,3-galactosyltransferase 1-like [Orbicella faveolata]|nr:beta-1,3-galactosyltransferase 1-like [Orbicella faveolata]
MAITSLHMIGILRRRRYFRLILGIAVIVFLTLLIKSIIDHFTQPLDRIDLRKFPSNYDIISPVAEPRGYSEQSLFFLVIVSTSPNNADRRTMIRQTWGNFDRNRLPGDHHWKVVFMMGKAGADETNNAIMSEYQKYGDLIIGNYMDQYRAIVTKVLMAFQWASKIRCSYILKTDDDVYVDVPKLARWLMNVRKNPTSFYGGVVFSGGVVRDKTHRHYISREELSLDYFPAFCKGFMYVISWSLIPKMVDLSRHVTRIGPDDAYVGLLAYQLGISPVRIEGFLQAGWLHWCVSFISLCQLRELLGIGDSLTPDQVSYVDQVKTSVSNTERYTVCISLHTKLFLLLFFFPTFLLFLIYRCCGRRVWRRFKK